MHSGVGLRWGTAEGIPTRGDCRGYHSYNQRKGVTQWVHSGAESAPCDALWRINREGNEGHRDSDPGGLQGVAQLKSEKESHAVGALWCRECIL